MGRPIKAGIYDVKELLAEINETATAQTIKNQPYLILKSVTVCPKKVN